MSEGTSETVHLQESIRTASGIANGYRVPETLCKREGFWSVDFCRGRNKKLEWGWLK